jgi:hypothetical protein
MINNLHNLKKFMGMFDIAQASGSQEVRLSITELSLVVSDVNKLLSTIVEQAANTPSNIQVEVEKQLDIDGGSF